MRKLNRQTERTRIKRKAARTEAIIKQNEQRFKNGDYVNNSFNNMLQMCLSVGKYKKP